MQPAVYINLCEDVLFSSNANGTAQTAVLTPKKYWGLGLNLAELVLGLRVKGLTSGGEVTVKWQWSLDGSIWMDGSPVGAPRTTDGDSPNGVFNANAEMMPWSRLVLSVRDTAGTPVNQKTAQVSAWAYYKFRY
jgi:hypothetical protein